MTHFPLSGIGTGVLVAARLGEIVLNTKVWTFALEYASGPSWLALVLAM